jgi:glycosyltransferase involved in cell wall biosynthesis
LRVIYLSHTGRMSGAERSLLELLAALAPDVPRLVASPEGPFADAARRQGERVVHIPATTATLRPHPIHTPVAVARMGLAGLAVARLARREGIDIVHANSLRAGLVAALARRLGAPPAVVYAHDCLPDSRLANLSRRALLAGSGVVLANSDYTKANLTRVDGPAAVRTCYYGMVDENGELVALEGRAPPRRAEARARLGFDETVPLIGLVAQITPWKGQDTAIEALARLRSEYPAARLLLVGETKFVERRTRFDNRAYLARLKQLVAELGLADGVEFLGERLDVFELIAALDVLVAPSWEEPFGRTIVEALAIGTPVVATAVGGPAEIIEDRISGRLVDPRDPGTLAGALGELLARPDQRLRLAEAGRAAAGRFGVARHVEGVLAAYGELLERATA